MSTMKANSPAGRDGASDGECVSMHQSFQRVKKSECMSMVEEFKCSISHKLPIEPVMASDVSQERSYVM